MENNHANKTEAELYHEERKKRMASAAKKNAKQSPQMKKAKKIAGKVIGIILIVLLACGALYGVLDFFGVPQKLATATKIGDEKVSVAKYSLYYMDVYQQIQGQAQQIESQYGKGSAATYMHYDPSKTPMEQPYTQGTIEGFEGENPTWADFFREETNHYLQSFLSFAKLAREANITLTDEEQANIDEQMKSLRDAAAKNDFSLNRYLTHIYGKGVNEKLLRESLEERILASKYAKQKQEDLVNAVTAEQIAEEFNAKPSEYSVVSVSGFQVSADLSSVASDATKEEQEAAKKEALAKAKEKADAYVAKIHNADDVLAQAMVENKNATKESVENNNVPPVAFGDEASKWLTASERKVGDTTVIESGNSYLVLYLTETAHKDETKPVDVRHILVSFPDNGMDEKQQPKPVTEEQKAETQKKAQAIYDEFLQNPTEENFEALAKSKSEDPGSKDNGGLYKQIASDGRTPDGATMVQEFTDWCHADGRKVGDSGIIKTTFGYHIMFLSSNDYPLTWETNVKNALATKANEEFEKEITEGDQFKITTSKTAISWASSQLETLIKKQFIKY